MKKKMDALAVAGLEALSPEELARTNGGHHAPGHHAPGHHAPGHHAPGHHSHSHPLPHAGHHHP